MAQVTDHAIVEFMGKRKITAHETRVLTIANLEALEKHGFDAGVKNGLAEGKDKGAAFGAKTERKRIQTILTCEEAEGRQEQAMTVAFDTDMVADVASKFLSSMPKEKPGRRREKTEFEKHMEQNDNSAIHADGDGYDDDPERQIDRMWSESSARVAQRYAGETG